jgi:hypothetical protein
MTQLHSTIFEIEYKISVIAHCRKTHDDPKAYPDTKAMMIRQCKAFDLEVASMINGDKRLNRHAVKIRNLFDLKEWLIKVRNS